MKNVFFSLIFLVLMVGLFSACKSSKKNDSNRIVPAEMVWGTSSMSPPFPYYNNQGELVGFEIDVVEEISKRIGSKPKYLEMEWTCMPQELLRGNAHAILCGLEYRPERAEKVLYSDAYMITLPGVAVKEGAKVFPKKAEDFKGLKIGVIPETTTGDYAKSLPGTKSVAEYDDEVKALTDLRFGRIDVALLDYSALVFAAIAIPGLQYYEYTAMHPINYHILFQPKDSLLCKTVNAAIQDMRADGTLSRLLQEYKLLSADVKAAFGNLSDPATAVAPIKYEAYKKDIQAVKGK